MMRTLALIVIYINGILFDLENIPPARAASK